MLVDGNTIYSGENTDPKDFENVKVYVSDPWYASFTSEYGLLENFKYYQPVEGKQMTENNILALQKKNLHKNERFQQYAPELNLNQVFTWILLFLKNLDFLK